MTEAFSMTITLTFSALGYPSFWSGWFNLNFCVHEKFDVIDIFVDFFLLNFKKLKGEWILSDSVSDS